MNTIVLICDENYIMPTRVMITSICRSAQKYQGNYQVYVLTYGLSEQSVQMLEKMTDTNVTVAVRAVDTSVYESNLNKICQGTHVTPTALLKFEIANIFGDLDRILYLDSDMVVKGDLQELFEINLNHNLVAASYEFWIYLLKMFEYDKDKSVPPFYFNSGVMLLNLELIRKEKVTEQFWKCKLEKYNTPHKNTDWLMDQDVFNQVCKDRVQALPIRYNCNVRLTYKINNKINIKDINRVFLTDYQNLDELKKDAVIYHFVGKEDKPWLYQGIACQELWDEAYAASGYKLSDLNREKTKRNMQYYWTRTVRSVKKRGFIKTFWYVLDKKRGGQQNGNKNIL